MSINHDAIHRPSDQEGLVDIRNVLIRTELPTRERIQDFIRQIGNPYCYRHGKYVVQVSFMDTDVLEERLASYLASKPASSTDCP